MSILLNDPISHCMDILESYFLEKMTELKNVIQDFPTPNEQLKYPSLSITHVADDGAYQSAQPYEDTISDPVDNKVSVVWVVGQWDYKIQLDFWCASEPERNRIFSKAKDVLNPNINPMGLRLQLPNYKNIWASFDLSGIRHEDNEQASQRGEWRIIATLLVNVNDIRENVEPAITSPIETNLDIVDNETVAIE